MLCRRRHNYKYAVEEELLEHSPAAHVRRPRLDYESHAAGLDRNELGALLVAAGLGPPAEHALISLLALNGLRVSEATGADIEALGVERGHRTLVITRKGGKVVTIPLAPRTARAIDLAVGERSDGPVFLAGGGWTGTAPGGSSAVSPAAPGSPSRSGRTRCGTRSSPPPSTPACRCATCRKPPPTPIPAPPSGTTALVAVWTGMPPTSSPLTSLVPPGKATAAAADPPGGHSRQADGRGCKVTTAARPLRTTASACRLTCSSSPGLSEASLWVVFPTSWRGAGRRFFDPVGARGRVCRVSAHGGQGSRVDVPKSAADPGRGQPCCRGGPFPGQAQVRRERAGQAQLDMGRR